MTLTSLMAEHEQLGDGNPAPSHEAPRQPGSRLALGHFKPPRKPKSPCRVHHVSHLPSVKLFIPVVNDRGRAGQPAVLDGVLTDGRHLAVPCQNCKADTCVSTWVGSQLPWRFTSRMKFTYKGLLPVIHHS